MTPYQVLFTKSARKEFDRLPARIREQVRDALTLLSHNPFTDLLKTKKLKGPAYLYRMRVGDYRIVYEVRKLKLMVVIIKVGHRRDIYRRL